MFSSIDSKSSAICEGCSVESGEVSVSDKATSDNESSDKLNSFKASGSIAPKFSSSGLLISAIFSSENTCSAMF